MFRRRLRAFVIVMTVVALVIVVRLVDVQVVRGDQYAEFADRLLTRPVSYLAAPRGSILDRTGRRLVGDEPASDISIRYEVLKLLGSDEPSAETQRYLRAAARAMRELGWFPPDQPTTEIVTALTGRIDGLWDRLADVVGTDREELVRRAEQIVRSVERVKTVVQANSDRTIPLIAEERQYHALLSGVDPEIALAVRVELEDDHPWLRVVPSVRRVVEDVDPLVHVLGRLGAASPGRIAGDALREDELRGLRAGDRCGISGVERVAETVLRGARGRRVEDFDRQEIDRVDPVRGNDVMLTIDADLQRGVFDIVKEAVDRSVYPAGGAAVVIDVETREVLALVSYPTYSIEHFSEDYGRLVRDKRWQPLRFRAVANMYPPGSTCKVIALYGGLADGVISPQTRIHCNGRFRDSMPNKFRCWIYNQYGTTHDARGNPAGQDADDAIRNSCNIFFYTVGDRLGVDGLCEWFSRFGLGRLQGTGLIEETAGIVPNSEWIETHRPSDPHTRISDAWNFAIGQGEVSATPLQAANVAATVASGYWAPVRLVRELNGNPIGDSLDERVEFNERDLRVLRSGMWRVVNERGATAFGARLGRDDFELCGKTGSAQASRRVIRKKYVLEWPDGRRDTVIATSKSEALARFAEDDKPKVVSDSIYELYPPRGADAGNPSHAWFIGYTQAKGTSRGASPRGRSYAIAAVIEFGGSGGRVAGPVVKGIAELLLEVDGK